MTHEEETTPDLSEPDDPTLETATEPSLGPSLDAARVIEQFGGIRPMAAKIGVAVTTVQGWKNRGVIPATRRDAIAAAAAEHGIELDETVGVAVSETGEGAAPEIIAATEPVSGPVSEKGARTGARPGAGLTWVALAVSLVAVAAATQPHWEQWAAPWLGKYIPAMTAKGGAVSNNGAAQKETTARIGARIDALATRLAALEAKTAARTAPAPDPELRQRLDALEAGDAARKALQAALAATQKRLATVEESLIAAVAEREKLGEQLTVLSSTASGTLRTAFSATQDRLKRVEDSLQAALSERETLAEQLAAAVDAVNSRAGALSTDLDTIRKAQHNTSNDRTAALSLALSGLEAVLVTDRPFQLALAALQTVAAEQVGDQASLAAALARIDPFAATGAPTLAQLTRRYHDLALELARRDSVGVREDWVGQTLDKIYTVVSWRRLDGPVDQAAAALAGRDLKGAADILAAHPEFEPLARDWISGARNRIAITEVQDVLRAQIVAAQAPSATKQDAAK